MREFMSWRIPRLEVTKKLNVCSRKILNYTEALGHFSDTASTNFCRIIAVHKNQITTNSFQFMLGASSGKEDLESDKGSNNQF